MTNKNKKKKGFFENPSAKWIVLGAVLLFLTLVISLTINSFKGKEVSGINYNAVVNDGQAYIELDSAKDATLREVFGPKSDLYLANGKQHTRAMYWIFKTDSGIYVYCIDLGTLAEYDKTRTVTSTSTAWENMSKTQKDGIELASTFGFPNKLRSGYSDEYQYLVTQEIIWEFQQGWRTNYNAKPTDTRLYDRTIATNTKVKALYDAIITDMREYASFPSFAARNEASAPTHALSYNTSSNNYSITLTDSNNVLSGLDITCTGATCTKSGNKLTVTVTKAGSYTISFKKKVPTAISQSKLIIDNGTSQRMYLGRPNINESYSYVKLNTEALGSLTIKKASEDGQKSGIEFTITGPNNYSKTVKTDTNGEIKLTNLKVGKYTVKEKIDTTKYIDQPAQTVDITTSALVKSVQFNNVLINKSVVKVGKKDAETKEYVAGAALEVRKGSTVVEKVTSTKGLTALKTTLEINVEYQLCETAAPAGYVINTTCVKFKVASKSETKVVEITNEKTKMFINKVDDKGATLQGAHLQILDSAGKVIDEWDTTKDKHEVRGLVIGQKYILRETKAPSTYIKAADQEFTAKQDTSVTMKNVKSKVIISKQDVTTGKELAGAHLELLDANGSKIDEWTSVEGASHQIEGLIVGAKYTLKETIAPEGYSITNSITFTVGATNPTKVVMKDELTKTYFSKQDATTGKEIEGAHLQILDTEGKVIEEWDSEKGKSKLVEGLIFGHTYILRETIAPYGYAVSQEIRFVVGDTAKVEMKDELTKVVIEKKDEVSEEVVVGAHLQLIGQDGKIIEEWDTTKDPHVLIGLPTGVEFTIKETVAPDGYVVTEPVKFTISASESEKTITVLNTPIIDVPDTAANLSVQAIIIGIILVLGGAGTIIWIKRKA